MTRECPCLPGCRSQEAESGNDVERNQQRCQCRRTCLTLQSIVEELDKRLAVRRTKGLLGITEAVEDEDVCCES